MGTFLVTGASRGIGHAISVVLHKQGHHVIGLARNVDDIDFPGLLIPCDLANVEQTAKALAQINEHAINGIVNNVGIALPQPLGQIDFATLHSVLDLNVRVAIQITQHFANAMKARRYGRIVNICSRAVFGARERTAYSAAKSALIGCTRTWALEFAEYGVTVNAVAPGPIETALFRRTRAPGSEAERRVLNAVPMRRIGLPEEIAAVVCFLLSEQASFITGQVLPVDGGASLSGRD